MKMKLSIVACAVLMVWAVAGPAGAQMPEGEELFPPNAQPGECYARVFVPPTYRTESQRVVKREASSRVEIVPAQYERVTETVVTREASERWEVVPAEYGYTEEQIMVKPARKRLVEVPAQYETLSEKVVDTPAHTVWKKGRGPIEKVDNATGEIMCLIEVPATYKTVTKRVLKSPATVQELEIPAEYKTVRKRVMKTPPSVRKIEIPAEYGDVAVTKMVQPPQTRTIEIPAEYQDVTSQVMVTEGRMEWQPVLCETNFDTRKVTAIQRALRDAGFDPGPIDGVIGRETLAAVRSYQQSKGLATGGLTLETIRSLGV